MNELYREITESGIEYIPRLIEGLRQAAAYFRQGNDTRGIEAFSKAFDGLEWVAAVIEGLPKLQPVSPEGEETFQRISQTLSQLEEAWAFQDFVSIADLTEYELVESLESLHAWFCQGAVGEVAHAKP
ncbi:hypothetical protein GTO91_07075 [Heliobacterium undosum]|uniref:DUF8042 domain-containing protein n=1 Tax=Heliomicrobium undosum TaxID=121734 RepID=A0A845L1H2_9FIRM|nr:hypothetical protein [Heliomicrobium undosum]MZP29466.1 hypothetical protein [Heliomicrobium undosum]